MENKVNKTSWIKKMFSMLRPTKQVDYDNYSDARNAAWFCQALSVLFIGSGALMLFGGIFGIATFSGLNTMCILLIVFGILTLLIAVIFIIWCKNVKARILVYQDWKDNQ